MARVIQENIKRPLANELLFGPLSSGGELKITVIKDKLSLKFVGAKESVT